MFNSLVVCPASHHPIRSASSLEALLRDIPVSINCQLGDPLQPSQYRDTLEKLETLMDTGHAGPIAMYTHWLVTAEQARALTGLCPRLRLHMSITGLIENRRLTMEHISESYLTACQHLATVIAYIRPVIPGQNDRPEIIEPILDLAARGHRIVISRGFKDIHAVGRPYIENSAFMSFIAGRCKALGLAFFGKTACAAADALGRPCAAHASGTPANVEHARSLGYDLSEAQGEVALGPSRAGPATRGDLNFLRILCGRTPRAEGVRNSTLLSVRTKQGALDCTSSWFTWARQTHCTVGCWYCHAEGNPESSAIGHVGANPIELMALTEKGSREVGRS